MFIFRLTKQFLQAHSAFIILFILKMATHNNRETLHRCNNTVDYKICDRQRRRVLLLNRSKFDKYLTKMIHEQPTKGFKRKKSVNLIVNRFTWCCTIVIALLPITVGQYSTRDPRFYSREGDFNYKWPNPGDPDYR